MVGPQPPSARCGVMQKILLHRGFTSTAFAHFTVPQFKCIMRHWLETCVQSPLCAYCVQATGFVPIFARGGRSSRSLLTQLYGICMFQSINISLTHVQAQIQGIQRHTEVVRLPKQGESSSKAGGAGTLSGWHFRLRPGAASVNSRAAKTVSNASVSADREQIGKARPASEARNEILHAACQYVLSTPRSTENVQARSDLFHSVDLNNRMRSIRWKRLEALAMCCART